MKYFIWFILAGIFLYWIIPSKSENSSTQPAFYSHPGLTRWNDSSYSTYYFDPEQPLFIRYTYVNNCLEQIDVRALSESAFNCSDTNQKVFCNMVRTDTHSNLDPISFEDFFQNSRVLHIPIKH